MADIWPSPTDKIMDNYSMNSSAFSTVTAPRPPTTLPRRSAAQVVRNSHEGQDELDESPGAMEDVIALNISALTHPRSAQYRRACEKQLPISATADHPDPTRSTP